MNVHERGLVFIGLPDTGKSTYLALLYLAIWQGDGPIKLGGVQDDRRYVNELSGRLFRCEPQSHTSFGNLEGLSLSIADGDGGALLQIPDVAGEAWDQALVDRSLPASIARQLASASGVCIFANVAQLVEDPTISAADHAAAALGAGKGMNEEFKDASVRATQVQLVDFIQIIRSLRESPLPRLTIILSAFDLVEDESPEEWVAMNLPLLDQYLRSNVDLESRVFGVSAQGGDFRDASGKSALAEQKPLARAFAKMPDGTATSVLAPALWALGALDL